MRQLDRTLRNILGLILILALTAGAVWLLANSRPRRPQSFPEGTAGLSSTSSQQSPLPTPTTALRAPDASPTPTSALPPYASPTPTTAPMPYLFGEPRIVLTHTAAIGISGWLPDSRQLLLTLHQPLTNTEIIETFDIVSGKRRQFGERYMSYIQPVWLEKLGKVAFSGLAINDLPNQRVDLWINGDAEKLTHEPVFRDVVQAISGYTDQVLAIERQESRLAIMKETGPQEGALQVDLAATGLDLRTFSELRMVWSPTGQDAAIFDPSHFLILNLQTGRIQKIDLGVENSENRGYDPRRVLVVAWSPNSRLLAMIVSSGEPIYQYSDLAILDIFTHTYTRIETGAQYITNIAWAPDSRYMTVLRHIHTTDQGSSRDGLLQVDTQSGNVQKVLPDLEFGGGDWGWEMTWSPDGRWLVVNCPTVQEGRLCILPVSQPNKQGE